MSGATEPTDSDEAVVVKHRKIVWTAVVMAFAGVTAVGLDEAFPHHVTNARDPSFVDNVFANPVIVFAVRVALLASVLYVVASVVGLIAGRRWISEVGPFKTTDPIRKLDRTEGVLRSEIDEAVAVVGEFEARLEAADEDLRAARARTDALAEHAGRLEREIERM